MHVPNTKSESSSSESRTASPLIVDDGRREQTRGASALGGSVARGCAACMYVAPYSGGMPNPLSSQLCAKTKQLASCPCCVTMSGGASAKSGAARELLCSRCYKRDSCVQCCGTRFCLRVRNLKDGGMYNNRVYPQSVFRRCRNHRHRVVSLPLLGRRNSLVFSIVYLCCDVQSCITCYSLFCTKWNFSPAGPQCFLRVFSVRITRRRFAMVARANMNVAHRSGQQLLSSTGHH